MWSVTSGIQLPAPWLLDDETIVTMNEALKEYAPPEHPLVERFHASKRVQRVLAESDAVGGG